MGENQDQQASAKAAACAGLAPALSWHFIGQLQSNKAPSVARYADMVHSVDRASLVSALGKAAERAGRAGRELRCLIQVSLDGTAGRGGAHPDEVLRLAALIAGRPGLTVAGVMAVAPPQEPAGEAFARLRPVRERLLGEHPGGRGDVGRHERRPGGRDRRGCDARPGGFGHPRPPPARAPATLRPRRAPVRPSITLTSRQQPLLHCQLFRVTP
ncbi:hypothetical protein GCM10020254_02890 [Streptomyces goshikiensis]